MRISGRKFQFTGATGGAAFTVRVVVGVADAGIVGLQPDGTLGVQVTAADYSAANAELIAVLAARLHVQPSDIEIVAGQHAAEKLVSIDRLMPEAVEARLGVTGLK